VIEINGSIQVRDHFLVFSITGLVGHSNRQDTMRNIKIPGYSYIYSVSIIQSQAVVPFLNLKEI
jgi:hypothetical protein